MDRKIRVMILTMVLTVLMFGGTRLMAQDLSNKPSETQTTPEEEKSKEEGSLAKTNENEEGSENADDTAKDTKEDNNGAVLPKGSDNPDLNKTATENNNDNLVKEAPKTKAEGAKTLGEETKTEEQVKAQEALEANKAKEEGKGKEDGSQLEASNSEKAQAPGTSREANTKPKKEFNPDDDKELNDLKARIKTQQDPSEKAKLQKEYNEKYLKKLEDAGANKTDEETAKRLKDDDIKKYNEIKAKQEEIDKKLKDENAKPEDIQKDIDELNKLLGDFNPPRALTADEQNALEELQNTPYVPSIDDEKTKENGKEIYETYEKAKKALEEAINPKAEAKTKEELAKLIKDFKDAEAALKIAIHDEIISPNYTKNKKPEIYIYPIDGSGRVIRKKDDNEAFLKNNGTYYIPDKTDLNLLFQINKDKEDKNSTKTFTFTISSLEKVGKVDLPNPSANNLVFLNDVPVKLIDNGNGSYTFTAKAKDNFGIAQLKFNMPGFKAAFHEGFTLTLTGSDDITQTNTFLITKKGYENEADLDGVGTKKKDDEENIPEIDAGKTHDKIVEADTDKVFNFFTVLKKNNTYINEVLVNSANGESLPLSSVNITITAPKNFDGNFAEFIHKSGLKYDYIGDGKYKLELNLKKFKKKDGFTVEDGQLKYNNQVIKNTEFTNAILEAANGEKKYIEDNTSDPIDVETLNVLVATLDNVEYQVRFDKDSKLQSLWKKDGANTYTKVKDFTNGKLVDGNRTFEIRGNELISYTKETDVYEGNVSNKKKENSSNPAEYEADPTVTPTFKGRQVTVKEGTNAKESYGGTIVEKKIFVKIGKNEETGKDEYKYLINQSGLEVKSNVYIDDSGRMYDSQNTEKTLKGVPNAVFKKVTKGNETIYYIVNDLVYKEGPTLIDKFGREKTNITVSKNGNEYTFTHTTKKDDKGNPLKITTETNSGVCQKTYGGRTITVGSDDKVQIFVNNKNYIEEKDNYKAIVGKYYYDKDKKEFFEAKDNDTNGNKVLGDKFYEGFLSGSLTKKLIEAYTKDSDSNKSYIVENANRYYGSINPKDFYTYNNRTYVKKLDGNDEYLESADGGEADIIANFTSQKVIQTIKIGNVEKYVITDEKDIFDAVQNAKFAFRFPGFLSGKKVIYNVKADVSAKYTKPITSEEVSIFSKKEVRTITKYFTIKTSEKGDPSFFKHKPEEFNDDKNGIPNYNFFNIFYRDSSDRERDKLIATLINHKNDIDKAKTAYENAKNDQNKKTYEDLAKKYKDDVELLDIIQKELAKRRDGAQFVLNNNEVEIQKNGEKVNVNRSLVWEIGFSSDEGVLFPEDKDTSIVVEDYNMDNRLVYDEIIINEEEKEWEKRKKDYEEAKKALKTAEDALKQNPNDDDKKNAVNTAKENLTKKKFTGSDEYFFLDQINNIRFGINRAYIEGGFIAVGPDFKITREEIIDALKNNDATKDVQAKDKDGKEIKNSFYVYKDNKHFIKKGEVLYEISRDEEKGQIRIKVLNAFYKDNTKNDKKDGLNKFYSPVQEAYENQVKDFNTNAESFIAVQKDAEGEKSAAEATKEAFEESFKTFIRKTYAEDSDCYHVLTHLFKKRLEKVSIKKENSNKLKTAKEMADELNKIKEDMVKAMDEMHLQYLDPSKGDYKFDDMRFNAIRFELNPNITIAGAIAPQKKKKFDISAVIVPNIDVPYTDEFGEKLTNKDMYINKFINQVLNDSNFTKTIEKFDKNNWNKKDESFVKVMREAYERLNKDIKEGNIKIADLVEIGNENNFAWEKYTIKKGNELGANDLAIDNEPLTNNAGGRINPWYIKTIDKSTGKASIKSLKELAGDSAKDALKELEKEFGDKAIDLFAYYMSKDGFNRAKFENEAIYKLPKQEQGPGIYGEENNWREKLCYPGVIGVCIEKSGGNQEPPTPGKIAKGSDGIKSKDNFTLIYQGTNNTPNEEHPNIDKKSDKTGPIDIAEEKDQKIKFTIEISVNQMTKSERQRYNLEKGMDPNTDLGESYSANGHYKYQNDTLIMDILPNIFKLSGDSKITLKVDTDALKNGDANAKIFENADTIKNWKEKIVYMHVDNLYDYYKNLPDGNKKEVLKKALEDAEKEGKITKDQKIQAVIAWLPEFEAPKGHANHFVFELENILVDKKEFKDYIHNGAGEEYVNNAAFGDKGKIYFAETTVTIKKGKEGSVDKFLRIYDENGKIINENDKKEWFKGNAKLKFGDKFDYKLRVHNKIDIQNTSRVGEMLSVIKLEDTLPNVDKGLKPVLRDFVEIQKGYENKFDVKYYIGETPYTRKQIEEAMAKAKKEGKKSDISLDKITKIAISTNNANVKDGDYRDFIIPMMIPELDAKIEDGKVVYIGTDGEKHELGKAEVFFNLNNLVSDANDLAAENKVKNSNTVTVYLEKNRFIRLFKEFYDLQKNEIKKNRPEMKFDIYQYQTDKDGKIISEKLRFTDKNGNPIQLTVNEANNFTDMVSNLPLFKKTIQIKKETDSEGNVVAKTEETITNYKYELKEVNASGYDVTFEVLDNAEGQFGFVLKAKNYEKPEIPPEYPKDHPKDVKVKIRVNKVWKVLNNGSTPSIQVELYANGKATGKIISLGTDGSWSASFEDLPSKDANGKEIIYTVREVGESNELTKIDDRTFEVIYTGNLKDGFTIINKEIPPDDEKPKDKKEPKKHKPNDEEGRDRTPKKNRIPKTGVNEDLGAIYFAFVLLLGLVFIKKRYLVK